MLFCASGKGIITVAPSISTARLRHCQRRRGISRFASGLTISPVAKLWSGCRSKRCARRSASSNEQIRNRKVRKGEGPFAGSPRAESVRSPTGRIRPTGELADTGGACAPQMIKISQPLVELDWIARPKILALRRLDIETAEDLLTHYPRRYEDRHQFPEFPREESDTPICLCGEVTKTRILRFGGWKKIFEATLQEPNAHALSQPLTLRWFNLHYVQKMIATGQQLVVFGKPKLRGKRLCMDHPEFEVIEDDEEMSIHFRRITPIYPATEGLSQRVLRAMIYRLLSELSDQPLETLLPPELAAGDRRAALRAIHFPETWEARDAAREHLVLTESFALP